VAPPLLAPMEKLGACCASTGGVTGNAEVIGSSVELVPTNALAVIKPIASERPTSQD